MCQVVIWRSYCGPLNNDKGNFGLWKLNWRRALPGSLFLLVILWLILKIQTEPNETEPQRFAHGPVGEPEPELERVRLAAAWSLGERSKGSPCRKPRRASLCPPPGTDGTASPVCLSASQFAAEQGRKEKCDWFPAQLEHRSCHTTKSIHIVSVVTAGTFLFLWNMFLIYFIEFTSASL